MPESIPFRFLVFGELLTHFYRLFKFEGQSSLGRQSNFFVAGKGRSGRACARSGCRADCCSLSATGQCSYQRSRSGAAANKAG
jgi:hypothetical protein